VEPLTANNIALRWSAQLWESAGYKHLAPLGRSAQDTYVAPQTWTRKWQMKNDK
jgi:hypothetical protein